MIIKKFQSPAGPIEYQQRMGGAFSVNDPNTAGYAEGGKRRAAMRKELYDVTHSMPYQIVNTGLYMAAPYTAGITAIPAAAMSAAALGTVAGDIADNGINVRNGINAGFDVLNAAPGVGLAVKGVKAAAARRAIPQLQEAANSAFWEKEAAHNAYNAAKGAYTDAADTAAKRAVAKAAAKRDAAAAYGSNSPVYRKASAQLDAVRKKNPIEGVGEFTVMKSGPGGFSMYNKVPTRILEKRAATQKAFNKAAENWYASEGKLYSAEQAANIADDMRLYNLGIPALNFAGRNAQILSGARKADPVEYFK